MGLNNDTITRARAAIERLRDALPNVDPGPWPTEEYYDAIEAMHDAALADIAALGGSEQE